MNESKVHILKIAKTESDTEIQFILDGEFSNEELEGVQCYINSIKYMDSKEPFPNFETHVNLYDEVPTEEELDSRNIDKLIVMSTTISSNRYQLCSLWGLQQFDKIDKILKNQVPWSEKNEKACWYGSTTGSLNLWAKTPQFTRYQLVREARKNPELIDAGFTNITQYAKKRPERFKNAIMNVVPGVDSYEQMKYKYIVVADGNVATHGFFWVLASGSVPLKQESEYIQYFEDPDSNSEILEPYVHYVPIKKDFSNLLEQIEWLKENDDEAKRIVENARSFAQRHFNLEAFMKQFRETVVS